jgi:hypothetical protein
MPYLFRFGHLFPHDETSSRFFDRPGRREAAGGKGIFLAAIYSIQSIGS